MWFVSYSYFEYKKPDDLSLRINTLPEITQHLNKITPLPLPQVQNYKFVGDVLSLSSEPKSFSLVTNGITIPTHLPEVLLEMY